VPLLLVLHGRDTTPAQELVRTGFAELAAHGDAVLAFPAGSGSRGTRAPAAARRRPGCTSTTSASCAR
jgi:poly(3-hydroxybutyrate) depolymerase